MSRGPSFIPDHRGLDPDTIEPFAEGAWFAWRSLKVLDVPLRFGIWWSDDGTRRLSLAVGDLHGDDRLDWETYAVEGAADGYAVSVCCHDTFEAAQACAIVFLTTGRYCSDL